MIFCRQGFDSLRARSYRAGWRSAAHAILAVSALAVGGCAETTDELPPKAEPSSLTVELAGKADGGAAYIDMGPLDWGTPTIGVLSSLGELQGWKLPATKGAKMELEVLRKGSSLKLDTVLFVFAPDGAGGFKPKAAAKNDDGGWSRLSKLNYTAKIEGEHLVLVTAVGTLGKGQYALRATCNNKPGKPCALPAAPKPPAPTPAEDCHADLLVGLQSCVNEWRMEDDPDQIRPLTPSELLERCLDAEPMAYQFDNLCASSQPPAFCSLEYWQFWEQSAPACEAPLLSYINSTGCVFGATWNKASNNLSWNLRELSRRSLNLGAPLSALEAEQVVLAVQTSAHSDVTSADEAISRTDDQEVIQIHHWDITNERGFVSYTFYAGDNRFGLVFSDGPDASSTDVVARINDSDVVDCKVPPGPGAAPCATSSDCGDGLGCVGANPQTFDGRCNFATPHPAEGMICGPGEANPCPTHAGLRCAGSSGVWEGNCFPAWNVGLAHDNAWAPIPDAGTLERSIQVSGLLTVTTDATFRLLFNHPAPNQVRITLENPAGTEAVLFEGDAPAGDVLVEGPVKGIPGDESANGAWTLRVQDKTKGGTGTLYYWTLWQGTRWD